MGSQFESHTGRATLTESLTKARKHLEQAEIYKDIAKAAADKGYHKAETLAACEAVGTFGVKTYIPEPDSPWQRVWTDKPFAHQRAVLLNRQRTRREYGKRLQRCRSEVVERTCDNGGARRSWLRTIINVGKRYLLQAAAHNLGLVLRKLLGAGKPREFAALWAVWVALLHALLRPRTSLVSLLYHDTHREVLVTIFGPLRRASAGG